MDPPILGLVGLAFALFAIVLAWREYGLCVGWAGSPDPWVPTWSASTGHGSDGSRAPELDPRPSPLTVQDIEARRGKILRWVRRFGVPESEAPNVAQRVIMEAWRARESYRPDDAEIDSWLFALSRNWSGNYLRSGWSRRVDLQDMSGAVLAAEGTPEQDVMRAERVPIARAILARLPPRLASVWTRYDVEGEPMRDVAAELGITLFTSWGQLRRARAMVAREVARHDAIEARLRPGRRK